MLQLPGTRHTAQECPSPSSDQDRDRRPAPRPTRPRFNVLEAVESNQLYAGRDNKLIKIPDRATRSTRDGQRTTIYGTDRAAMSTRDAQRSKPARTHDVQCTLMNARDER